MRLMPFSFINSENSFEVNCEPLCLMSCCGMPYRARKSQSLSIAASLVMLDITSTSSHFE